MTAKKSVQPETFRRSPCPIAATLDVVGDKWTLLIVRDLVRGRRRFSQFLEAPEGIKRNILAERLKRLERGGLVRRVRYQVGPPRFEYRLTARGAALLPVLQSVARWGIDNFPGAWNPGAALFDARTEQLLEG